MELYVWGTGCAAGDLLDRSLNPNQITAFVDSMPAGDAFMGRPVILPNELRWRRIDLILVASRHADVISAQAAELGIDADKLIFLRSNWVLRDRNTDYSAAEGLLDAGLITELRTSHYSVRDPLWVNNSRLEKQDLENDYVRLRSLEALCACLEDVPGAAAELGVYKGGFARNINLLLPDRTLYLFDTFTGFDAREAAEESVGFVQAHRNTNGADVMRRMPFPEKIILRPGLFPESLGGLEERFALVSLDVDLEQSTLAGLRYFYPRLEPGGYLLLHDYASPKLPGVRRAFKAFEQEWGRRIPAVPLCDINGTFVLCRD